MERKLDRLVEFDERSRAFPVRAVLYDDEFRNYTWPCKANLDQGTEGACVGFAFAHELAAIPFKVTNMTYETALAIYRRAQFLDQWPGEAYEGTSVIAGMKAVQERTNEKGQPLIAEYRWAFGLEDAVRAVGRKGPAVLGINWYSDMFNTDYKGYIKKGGYLAGGHAIMMRGVSVKYIHKGNKSAWDNVDKEKSYATLHNSWGTGWGVGGTCKISFTDLEALLHEYGECVVPIVRHK